VKVYLKIAKLIFYERKELRIEYNKVLLYSITRQDQPVLTDQSRMKNLLLNIYQKIKDK
jgi:hypothetical protein